MNKKKYKNLFIKYLPIYQVDEPIDFSEHLGHDT